MKRIYILPIILLVFLFVVACNGGDSAGDDLSNVHDLGTAVDGGEDILNEEEVLVSPEGFPIDPATGRILPNVPNRDFEGHEFTILAHCTSFNVHWFSRDISAEELIGEPINDAVYHRNRAVEERFNITIRADYSGTPPATARESIMAGDGRHDVITMNLIQTAILAQEGMLFDLTNVEYIDLEKPWWDQRANRHLSINNRLFFTVGDLLVIDNDSLLIFFVNNDAIRDWSFDCPYQMVRDGTWTIDRMWEMATQFSHDVNGDGEMTGVDAWGLLTQYGTFNGNVFAAGTFIASKDSNDLPVVDMMNPRMISSFNAWIEIMMDRAHTMYAQDFQGDHLPGVNIWDNQVHMLSEGRGLFMFTHLNRATMMRPLDFNFGILPNPKLDEFQDSYYNYVHKNTTKAISIPVTADSVRSGMILEALAAESRYTLREAYFYISLGSQLLRDSDSEEMLELIFETRAFDLAHAFGWGGAIGMINGQAQRRESNFVSGYEAISQAIEIAMNNTVDFFLGLD